MKLLHLAAQGASRDIWLEPFCAGLRELGELEIIENSAERSADELAALIRACDILLTSWGAAPVPASLAADSGRLKYICHVTGTVRGCIPLEVIDAGIPVTNWGDAPALDIAEGALALMLAAMKDLRSHTARLAAGGWREGTGDLPAGRLRGTPVGIYGCGAIGRVFVELVRPLRPVISIFDPYIAELPAGCARVDSLDELFSQSRIVVIHAGLSDETRGSVTAEHLALLADDSIVVNTARGAIIDHKALFAELASGRLRAGLDVTDPEPLPPEHPARQYTNCVITPHYAYAPWKLLAGEEPQMERLHEVCLENVARFARGESLEFVMDRERYLRST